VSVLLALLLVGAEGEPPLTHRTLDGRAVEITRREGERALVVHFWATWCTSCAEELPALSLAASSCGSAVRVVAVDVDEDPAVVTAFAAEHGITLPILLDPDGAAWRGARLPGLPANLVATADGVRRTVGPTDEAHWRERLRSVGCDR
jgi:thiol-disulfide isomerase/thioredoxin